MKNRSAICAALALGAVLGATAASLVPHALAAPTAATPDPSFNARLDALEKRVNGLQDEVKQLQTVATTTTVYESAPQIAAPKNAPALGQRKYWNIPPYQTIPLSTPAR